MDRKVLYEGKKDERLVAFSTRLIPNLDYPLYGIRLPELKKISKHIDTYDIPITYHEDVILRGYVIANMKCPAEEKLRVLDSHLDYLKTWDETDTLASALKFKVHEIETAYSYFTSLLSDERVYSRRLAVVWIMLNRNKVREDKKAQLDRISKVKAEDYYIQMALAWALCTYYTDDSAMTEPYILKTSEAVQKMTRSKIRDSRKVRC